MRDFSPRLEILPAAQRTLWAELSATPNEFVLYGGTALALHLGHRSVDFDFFANRDLNLSALETTVPFLRNARVVQRAKNTLSTVIDREGPVTVSFFDDGNLRSLGEDVKQRLVVAAREVDLERLPELGPGSASTHHDPGLER
jgi:hypothetical protein